MSGRMSAGTFWQHRCNLRQVGRGNGEREDCAMAEYAGTLRKGTYQHYKGALYEVLGIAEDPDTANKWVVYESIGITEDLLAGKEGQSESGAAVGDYVPRIVKNPSKGALAVCTFERFTQEVDGGDYWNSRRVPRFRLLSPMPVPSE
jgi:hypothetical protein